MGSLYHGAAQSRFHHGAAQAQTVTFSGTVAIVAAVVGSLLVTTPLEGTAAGVSAASARLTKLGEQEISGTAAGVSATTASLGVTRPLAGTSAAVSSVTASLTHHKLYTSIFYGYREIIRPRWVGRIELPLWELDGPVPSQMRVYTGNAPDTYGAMTAFDWQSEILLLQAWDKNAMFQLSNDGITYEDEREVDPAKHFGSWFHRYAARGFRVKNKTASQIARYQVIAYR